MIGREDQLIRAKPDELIPLLEKTLDPRKYSNFRHFASGNTREIFLADWGLPGTGSSRQRIVKVEKLPQNPRALLHHQRGYGNQNELSILLGIGKHPSIVQLHDYKMATNSSDEPIGLILVEERIHGETLQQIIKKEGSLRRNELLPFAQALLQTSHDLITDYNLVHRDLHPGNIFITKRGPNLELMINDFVNATLISGDGSRIKESPLVSSGSKSIFDPNLSAAFTGELAQYNPIAEAHAIGKVLYFAKYGEMPYVFDPCDPTNVVNNVTSDPLVDESGRLIFENASKAAAVAARKMWTPFTFTYRYYNFFKSILSPVKQDRFDSINSYFQAFKEVYGLSLSNMSKSVEFLRGSAVFSVGAGILLFYFNVLTHDQLEHVKQHGKDFRVTTTQSKGLGVMGLENNYLRIKQSFAPLDAFLGTHFEDVIVGQPGDKFHVSMTSDSSVSQPVRSLVGRLPGVEGRLYIEGHSSGSTFSQPADKPIIGGVAGVGDVSFMERHNLVIPDLEPGVYNVILELYAPQTQRNGSDPMVIFDPGSVIYREYTPLIVGDVPEALHLSQVYFDDGLTMLFSRLNDGQKIDPDLVYKATLLNADTTITPSSNSASLDVSKLLFHLPHPEVGARDTLVAQVLHADGSLIHTSVLPIVYEQGWSLDRPDSTFSSELQKVYTELR